MREIGSRKGEGESGNVILGRIFNIVLIEKGVTPEQNLYDGATMQKSRVRKFQVEPP